MPRPVKWRRIVQMPDHRYFAPEKAEGEVLAENILKIEELEAIRLKDLEGFDQEGCAEIMQVSRQTFQRIYNAAKTKVADSLVNGKAIRISGGDYTRNICVLVCEACGNTWENKVETLQGEASIKCPECGAVQVHCAQPSAPDYCRTACDQPGMGRGRGMGRGGMGRGRGGAGGRGRRNR